MAMEIVDVPINSMVILDHHAAKIRIPPTGVKTCS